MFKCQKLAKENLPAIKAFTEGRDIQFLYGNEWRDYKVDAFSSPAFAYSKFRVKQQPTYRPWRPEEVPVGALLRQKNLTSTIRMIVGYESTSRYPIRTSEGGYGIDDVFNECEYSTDNGKTWNPCGVLE